MTVPSPQAVEYETLKGPSGQTIYVTGAPLELGPLPALWYFALAGDESLSLDPFNQPVAFLKGEALRSYSMTLPGHGLGFNKAQAMTYWANEGLKNENFINDFIASVSEQVQYLIDKEFIDPENLGAAGLSRGGYIAAQLAAKEERIQHVLGFSPLSTFATIHEFPDHDNRYALTHQSSVLCKKNLRFYIGNNDTRVGTAQCFHFINSLVASATEQNIRSPQVELIIYPSIGHKGHGTAPHIFYEGVQWIKKQLLQGG